MSQHTPGPWTIKSEEFEEIWAGETMIAEVFSRHPAPDARLIAAAPEMYALLDEISVKHALPEWDAARRALLAKIEDA